MAQNEPTSHIFNCATSKGTASSPKVSIDADFALCLFDRMFSPKHNPKHDPEKQWNLPDRIFFGFGACHILAGVFLAQYSHGGFYGEWIEPNEGFRGSHVYATNGLWAFDFHGYSEREKLLARYWQGHQSKHANWNATIEIVNFSLLDTVELNKRRHRGPNQYFENPVPRAARFIASRTVPAGLVMI